MTAISASAASGPPRRRHRVSLHTSPLMGMGRWRGAAVRHPQRRVVRPGRGMRAGRAASTGRDLPHGGRGSEQFRAARGVQHCPRGGRCAPRRQRDRGGCSTGVGPCGAFDTKVIFYLPTDGEWLINIPDWGEIEARTSTRFSRCGVVPFNPFRRRWGLGVARLHEVAVAGSSQTPASECWFVREMWRRRPESNR